MSKPNKKYNRPAEVEDSEQDRFFLPDDYKLRPGDVFIPYDPQDPEQSNIAELLENYCCSRGDAPQEVDADGNFSPLIDGVTRWFNVSDNVVYVYGGLDPAGEAKWTPDDYANRFVSLLDAPEDPSSPTFMGRIVNKEKERVVKILAEANNRIDEILRATPSQSFKELLDSI